MQVKKLNRPSKERNALTRNLATDLVMNGKVETTVAKAKYLKSYVEKYLITPATRVYDKIITVTKYHVDEKGNKVPYEAINDAPEKLAVRRQIINKTYRRVEPRKDGEKKADYIARIDNIKDPVCEKIFNVYAPKYAERARDLKQGGGYTRIIKTGKRRGDNADMAIVEFV